MMKLHDLNEAQLAAVQHEMGPMLILAGAGSGKTRVITFRVASVISKGLALPGEILALTFTNKAAKEMKERIGASLSQEESFFIHDMWVSTFHSTGARWLREHGNRVGLQTNFTIFDSGDQISLIKDCMKRLELNDKVLAPKAIMQKVNSLKNQGMNPKDFTANMAEGFFERKIATLLPLYQKRLEENNAVDFGDLILKSYELFKDNADLLDEVQERFRFILVDEYQDTNPVQYKLLKLLSSKYRNICVVGDEDQSIYKWRGADIRNILDFEKDFPDAAVFKLEENYRSSNHIIRAANQVISNNSERKDKNIFTNNPDGSQVEVHKLGNDYEEARWVVKKIKELTSSGEDIKDMAILYRTHAQSRLFEDSLRYDRIHYKIYGGLKFYDRAEVKDALAYLKIFINPRDDISLLRIINVPVRGIGKSTIEKLISHASSQGISILESIQRACAGEVGLGTGPVKKLNNFLKIYVELAQDYIDYPPKDFYAIVLEKTGYIEKLKNENSIEASTRIENLEELANAIGEFESRQKDPQLEKFLEEIALLTDFDRDNEAVQFITLMTLHAAKGLEFSHVFIVGMEEGSFPSIRDPWAADPEKIEEERRLCYVGMTRAEKNLFMSTAHVRKIFGQTQVREVSRFIEELPKDEIRFFDHEGGRKKAFSVSSSMWGGKNGQEQSPDDQWDSDFGDQSFPEETENNSGIYKIGQRVQHPNFGPGVIIQKSGLGENVKLSIKFDHLGTKKFVARFAPLELLQ